MTRAEFEVLCIHRDRVAAATTYHEFHAAQLKLLDWMIESSLHYNQQKAMDNFVGIPTQ